MKQKLQSLLRGRRGISIAETAVALAIIMIVSAAAVSLLSATTRVEEDAIHTTEISVYAESALECFRWATIDGYFKPAAEQLGFEKVTDPPEDLGENEYLYVLERSDYRMEIKVNFDTDKFEISAVDENGEEIYGFTYEK